MDQIKKKMNLLKEEREAAQEKADDAEASKKEAEAKLDEVSMHDNLLKNSVCTKHTAALDVISF